MLVSLGAAALAVPLSVLVASWAGFAMTQVSRFRSPALVAASVVALMVPVTALLVPRFVLYRLLGLTDTLVPLVLPALLATSPFYVLVYYLAFPRCRATSSTPPGWPTCRRSASGGGWRCRWSGRSPRRWRRWSSC